MSVSYVERANASAETLVFYDKAEARFEMLLNIFKVFGHTPELGMVFTDMIMAILKDGELDWTTKELIILKATRRNQCAILRDPARDPVQATGYLRSEDQ